MEYQFSDFSVFNLFLFLYCASRHSDDSGPFSASLELFGAAIVDTGILINILINEPMVFSFDEIFVENFCFHFCYIEI